MAIYKLNEDNYGGIFDIDDDIFFTKEEIVEFGNDIAEEFDNIHNNNAYLLDVYFDTPKILHLDITDDEYEYPVEVRIDMRKIRRPRDIDKYKKQVLVELERQYEDYHQYDNYYESYRLKESDEYDPESYDTNDIWTVVCVGDLENVKRLVTDSEIANERHNAFGMKHSLIMGAVRNNEPEVVSYLIRVGGTIEPSETAEFATYVKKNGNNIDLW